LNLADEPSQRRAIGFRELGTQLRWAIGDPVVRLAAAVAVLSYVPYLLPISREALAEYAYYYRNVPLLLVLVTVFVNRTLREKGGDRRFFGLLTGAFAVWLSVYVSDLFLAGVFRYSLRATFVEDLLWVVSYLLLALAVQLREAEPHAGAREDARRALEAASVVVLTFGLLVYFVVLPSALNPEAYGSFTPSLLLYAGLDLYLLLRFARATRRSSERRYPTLGWLAAAAAIWLSTDTIDALGYVGILPGLDYGSRTEWVYLPGLVVAIVAARAQPSTGCAPRAAASETSRMMPAVGTILLPLLLVAFHFGLYDLGFLDPITRPGREIVLMLLVTTLALLGLASQRLLERENERLSAERSAALVRLQESQRLESLGRLTAGIAHDFNNLLTVILGTAQVVERDLRPANPELAREVQEITKAGERGATVVRQLLAYARQQRLIPRPTALPAFIRSRIPTLSGLLPAEVTLTVRGDDVVPAVLADGAAIEQVLVHLVQNACDAMPEGGEVTISTDAIVLDSAGAAAKGVAEPGRFLAITVSDTGAGMDAEIAQRACEPFFTTKSAERGSGLGLAMVQGIAAQHGGGIALSSAPGRGTSVVVYLPAQGVEMPLAQNDAFEPKRGAETVLVVEDQEAVRRIATRVLQQAGYQVLEATDGREGLEMFRRHRDSIGLIVSDVVMPESSGPELLAAVRAEAPVPFLFTSGFAPDHGAGSGPLPPEVPFIHKPWSVLDFLGRVREVLDGAVTADPDRT
jgi:signal transduction histidine kinase